MLNTALPSLTIDDLTVPTPIIQGGMGIGVSLSGLASAVANAGGIGVIATAGIGWEEPDFEKYPRKANARALRKQIQIAKSLTQGILGVNIMVALTNYADMVKTAVEEGIDIIFSGAGLPLNLPKLVQDMATSPKLAPIVSSARAAKIIIKKWSSHSQRYPDAIVVEGPMAGGHLGFKPEQLDDPAFHLDNIIADVVETVRPYEQEAGRAIPVIAAGGVYTGADIRKYLDMGASGVQMGTRFVATDECDAAHEFKQAYVDAHKNDLGIIKSPVGLPGRAIRNCFVKDQEKGLSRPDKCPYHCLKGCDYESSPFCISDALIRAKKGDVDDGLVFAGSNAYRVESIIPVQELMDTLAREYAESAPTMAKSAV